MRNCRSISNSFCVAHECYALCIRIITGLTDKQIYSNNCVVLVCFFYTSDPWKFETSPAGPESHYNCQLLANANVHSCVTSLDLNKFVCFRSGWLVFFIDHVDFQAVGYATKLMVQTPSVAKRNWQQWLHLETPVLVDVMHVARSLPASSGRHYARCHKFASQFSARSSMSLT